MIDFLTSALATLLVVADPIFLSAIFLGLTSNLTPKDRREVALRGSIIAFCILVAAGLGGAKLLELLGISLSAFRIAGGLLLLSAAAEMVFDRRSQRLQATAETAVSRGPCAKYRGLPACHSAHGGARSNHRHDSAGRQGWRGN